MTVALSRIASLAADVLTLRMQKCLHEKAVPQKWWSVRIGNSWLPHACTGLTGIAAKTLSGCESVAFRNFELRAIHRNLLDNIRLLPKSCRKQDLSSFEHQIYSRHQPKGRITPRSAEKESAHSRHIVFRSTKMLCVCVTSFS